jgi:O-antigen ligase
MINEAQTGFTEKIWKLCLSLIVGLVLGALLVLSVGLPSDWRGIILIIPFALTVAVIVNNLEKVILATIAIGVPLNLDFSVMISPYARNTINIGTGERTIVALTELRVSLILIVIAIGYALWFIKLSHNRTRPIRFFSGITIPASGLIFISILSLLQAKDLQLSLFRIFQLVELFLLYLYLANHIRTKQEMQFFANIFMLGMFAECILMIVQWRTGLGFSIAGISADLGSDRVAGTLGSANTAGSIIAAFLAVVSAMFWLFPKRPHKVFAVVYFVVGCIALLGTGGRAAWAGFIMAIVLFSVIGWRRGLVQRKSLILMFLLTLVIGGIFYPVIYNRLTADDRGSAASRLKMFRLAWNVIEASPSHMLFGVGANNYALIAPAYNTAEVGDLGYVIDSSVHNLYLLTWAETGLVGLLCFLGFLIVPFVKVWGHIKSDNRFVSMIALGLGCALAAMNIQMFVDPFVARPKMVIVWLLVSLIASLDNLKLMEARSYVSGWSRDHEYC